MGREDVLPETPTGRGENTQLGYEAVTSFARRLEEAEKAGGKVSRKGMDY